jgi:glycosyltransferase involved in cell wall biosynthesis
MSFWLTVLIIAHVIQTCFWLWIYNSLPSTSKRNHTSTRSLPGVSVVIAAKNEADNLTRHLPAILSQAYPNYEVIVIDDHSTDISLSVLIDFAQKHRNLIFLPAEEIDGKKNALSIAITQAKHPWILCTDADCIPNSKQWIKEMLAQHDSADMILGYGPYHAKPTLLSAFVDYETWYIALQYMTAALHNRAYMGVGRNLAFRKNLWEDVGGYKSHKTLCSGDDDLFVNAVANKRILIETDSKSWTSSIPPSSVRELWEQKRRHLTTATSYSSKNKFFLALNFLSALIVYALSAYLCYTASYCVLLLMLFRWFYQYFVSYRWMKKLGILRLWTVVPFLDFILTLYYSIHGVIMLIPKKGW